MGISKKLKGDWDSPSPRCVDLEGISRGLWLVKVPKCVAAQWERTPANTEAGRIRVTREPGRKSQVSLELCEPPEGQAQEVIPRCYEMQVSALTQTLGVFSNEVTSTGSNKLMMEGKIIQKFECRPHADDTYMRMKLAHIKKAAQPKRQVVRLDRAVQNYKPVSDHKNNIEYAKRKKTEGKMLRQDKDVVLDVLFAAFEKHQYYNIKDLVKITKQPVVYLKEILVSVCNYNMKNPHRNMWELKPEYRHYEESESADNK